jgi:hypothetical protein
MAACSNFLGCLFVSSRIDQLLKEHTCDQAVWEVADTFVMLHILSGCAGSAEYSGSAILQSIVAITSATLIVIMVLPYSFIAVSQP